jgi:hypothetical protein
MLKGALSLAVSTGVGAIVNNAVKHTTPDNVKTLKKICITIGTFALSGMVSDAVCEYTDKKIDETAIQVKGFLSKSTE